MSTWVGGPPTYHPHQKEEEQPVLYAAATYPFSHPVYTSTDITRPPPAPRVPSSSQHICFRQIKCM